MQRSTNQPIGTLSHSSRLCLGLFFSPMRLCPKPCTAVPPRAQRPSPSTAYTSFPSPDVMLMSVSSLSSLLVALRHESHEQGNPLFQASHPKRRSHSTSPLQRPSCSLSNPSVTPFLHPVLPLPSPPQTLLCSHRSLTYRWLIDHCSPPKAVTPTKSSRANLRSVIRIAPLD